MIDLHEQFENDLTRLYFAQLESSAFQVAAAALKSKSLSKLTRRVTTVSALNSKGNAYSWASDHPDAQVGMGHDA